MIICCICDSIQSPKHHVVTYCFVNEEHLLTLMSYLAIGTIKNHSSINLFVLTCVCVHVCVRVRACAKQNVHVCMCKTTHF